MWNWRYLHKYMHKQSDKIRAALKNGGHIDTNDEIEMFQVFRYTSASEAICRIMGQDLSDSSVGCTRLPVHLEGMNWVESQMHVENGDERYEEEEAGRKPTLTLLERYFLRPKSLAALKYAQYYANFSVKEASESELEALGQAERAGNMEYTGGGKNTGEGGKRGFNPYHFELKSDDPKAGTRMKVSQRNSGSLHVARLYYVRPTAGDVYFLRLLLCHVPAYSFKELRTYQGTVHVSFRAACEARNLLSKETEFFDSMLSATLDGIKDGERHVAATPAQLRFLFITLVLNGTGFECSWKRLWCQRSRTCY